MRRTALLVSTPLLAAVLLAAGGAPAAAAAGGSDHVTPASGNAAVTTTDAVVTVTDGPADDHTVAIDTRLYVPATATAADPAPAILMTHGFGLSKTANEVVSQAQFLAANGYVVLTYTSSGFGGSGGCVTLQSADYDVKDAMGLIDQVLEPRPDVAHDGDGAVVGMVGGSYGGGITLNVAAFDKRVKAIVPGRTWNALQYSLDPNNRVVPGDPSGGFRHLLADQGVFKREWTSLFFASGNAEPTGGLPPDGTSHGGCPQDKLASGDPAQVAGVACPGFYAEVCRVYATVSATGDADDTARALLARSSGETFLDRITAPTLLEQGQSDTLFNENDAVATFTGLRARGVPVAMVWNSGGHGGYSSQPGECEVYDGKARDVATLNDCYLTLRTLGWFDHWLRGVPGTQGPTFAYYRDWVRYAGSGADDEQYGAADTFPPTAATTFTLSGGDALVAPGGTVAAGSASFVNPPGGEPASYTETSNFTGPDASPSLAGVPPTDVPGEFVTFTAAPFTAAVDAVGVPAAHLRLSHANGQDLVFYGKVYDVAPDGSAELIHRLIAPVRVPAAAVDAPVDIRLLGIAHRFAAGHAVRLELAATDQTSYNAVAPDQVTVTTGGTDPSTFTLPAVVPAAAPGPASPSSPSGSPAPSAAPSAAGSTGPSTGTGALPTTGPSGSLPYAAVLLAALGLVALATRAGAGRRLRRASPRRRRGPAPS